MIDLQASHLLMRKCRDSSLFMYIYAHVSKRTLIHLRKKWKDSSIRMLRSIIKRKRKQKYDPRSVDSIKKNYEI